MQIRFLLGPAGSGKTYRCLAEIRDELLRSPVGGLLVLLAPKQATFQLERQLLDPALWGGSQALAGYTRLRILSFERLAEFIHDHAGSAPVELLGEAGRVMALRALLAREQPRLKVFRGTARLPGFAGQMNLLLREFQRQRLSPRRLERLSDELEKAPSLSGKLRDSALLLESYLEWLGAHALEDGDRLLDLGAEALGRVGLRLSGLWLDGFAEMTPQELNLLGALLPCCDRATLAFCLDVERGRSASWLTGWSEMEHTYSQCRERAEGVRGAEIVVERLARDLRRGRFREEPVLFDLERRWSQEFEVGAVNEASGEAAFVAGSVASPCGNAGESAAARLVNCVNPEAEAVVAAREILRFARGGGRFREVAVLVRRLEGYHELFGRVFRRFGIPFFLDRREPVVHHPLAELTRYAVRLAAFGWQHDDWFGVLKTGLATEEEEAVDHLENEALARGWAGAVWLQSLRTPEDPGLEQSINRWLSKILPPFLEWNKVMAGCQRRPTGEVLVAAMRRLWEQLGVEKRLNDWSLEASESADGKAAKSAVDLTVLEQLDDWLENVVLAFGAESMGLWEWLPILEAGLANLSVGSIPPALDQVLIGAIDRSRNPELKLAILPGWNETVFPAVPSPGPLLTEFEREALAGHNVSLAPGRRQQIGQERYYAYIGCTRSSRRLLVTCSARDSNGSPLNPSPFFDQVSRLTGVGTETFGGATEWRGSEHVSELLPQVLRAQADPAGDPALVELGGLDDLAPAVKRWRQLRRAEEPLKLSPEAAGRLYGRELKLSVSGLEEFAACPFKFFAARGLRLQERRQFQFDDRDKGSFQHELLKAFHERVVGGGHRWRDLTPAEARELISVIGRELMPTFGGGRFVSGGGSRFIGELLIQRVERLVAVLIEWMGQYEFDPGEVEVGFGLDGDRLPAWRLEVVAGRNLLLRGRIDRVDLWRGADGAALAVVMDYKSSVRTLNLTKLQHGLELQLLSYLGVLGGLQDPGPVFGVKRLSPAGVFYIPVNGGLARAGTTRTEILGGGGTAWRSGYQHSGRFLAEALERFDNRGGAKGDQFRYAIKKDGGLSARGNDALPAPAFQALRENVEAHLREFAGRIFEGELAASPFRIGSEVACDRCDFRSVCRFDPWVQPYRELRMSRGKGSDAEAKE